MTIVLREITPPDLGALGDQPVIPASTYEARCGEAYRRAGSDWLVVYGDREHFGNIAFISGFDPRFEEALLLLGPRDRRVLVTGNECESYAALAGLPDMAVMLAQTLSLMGQDRSRRPSLVDVLRDAGLSNGDTIGLVGWKYLEPSEWSGESTFFVPAVYVDALRAAVGPGGTIRDATAHLMHPETGLRARIDVDQVAAFEWASARCSDMAWRVVSGVRVGDSEFEAVGRMGYQGDLLNVHTMLASGGAGETIIGLRSPTARRLRNGDGVTTAVGLAGGLSSRAGLVSDRDDEFLKIASAYFEGLAAWYATAKIGVEGQEIFAAVADALACGGLRSALNPGHLTGHEEWVHTPIRVGSSDRLRSGMPFQVDIIPVPLRNGWALNCEDGVALADAALQDEIRARYPAIWSRMEARRNFMREQLGVEVGDEVLPLSSTPMCLPPFWLKPGLLLARG